MKEETLGNNVRACVTYLHIFVPPNLANSPEVDKKFLCSIYVGVLYPSLEFLGITFSYKRITVYIVYTVYRICVLIIHVRLNFYHCTIVAIAPVPKINIALCISSASLKKIYLLFDTKFFSIIYTMFYTYVRTFCFVLNFILFCRKIAKNEISSIL